MEAVPALALHGLVKRFGAKTAVQDVSLSVPAGSFYGLVGPNGAGKTTSISMAVGLLRPDAGEARILGVDVWADPIAARALVGVLPDGLALPERLTGAEMLTYLGRLRGLDRRTAAARAAELLEILDLAGADCTLVNDYSTGMRKKIGLATALLHGPRLLVLDEPFEAVDPVSAMIIRGILRLRAGPGAGAETAHRQPAGGRAGLRAGPRRADAGPAHGRATGRGRVGRGGARGGLADLAGRAGRARHRRGPGDLGRPAGGTAAAGGRP